jgi:uncharacterized protein
MHPLTLSLLKPTLAVCRLSHTDEVPAWVWSEPFFCAARTEDELSLVLLQDNIPDEWTAERDWRALKVRGPLDFSLTGILASLAAPLAAAGISIFALSTFDTDYLLVRSFALEEACRVLADAGFKIQRH